MIPLRGSESVANGTGFVHLMDMHAFAELGPEGRNLLVDCAVNASLDWMTQGMFPENWQSIKTDLLEVLNQRQ